MYPYIAPENFDNSRISSITNDQLIIKLSDLLKQKEILKYITSKESLISIIKKYCEFFKISDDQESIEYILPDGMTVFNILNIPLNMNKEEVIKNIELINLQYNRLYKRGFYWVLCTTEKETVICLQNSLRDLYFEESKVKYDLNNKNQILRNMKEQIEKNLYQKDTKNLGITGNNKNKNNFNRGKISDTDSDAFSWRKGSNDIKSSFDVNDKQGYKKSSGNYYNNNNNYKSGYQKKRNRYNSDIAGQSYNNNNNYYDNNNNNYYHHNNNHYKNNYNNNKNNNTNNNKDIEIDISNLKYPILIKNKYSFNDIKTFYQKICTEKLFPQKPDFISKIFDEIISDSQKKLVALDELIESSKVINNEKNKEDEKEKDKININLKLPKMNPLSNIGKGLKNENNIPSTVEENTKEE